MRADRGVGWVYAADEFYLQAGETLPSWDDYDGFPQFENGIGMARAFLDECSEALREAPESDHAGDRPRTTLVTGELFAPVLDALAPPLARTGCDVRVLTVRNDLLGGNVNVAGLLSGADIAKAISSDACARMGGAEIYLVPEIVTNEDGLMLDDLTLVEVATRAGQDVRLVSSDAAGLVCALRELSSTT
jgi:NifB/MoaA-like Fe-S oxidoreductase